MKSEQMPDRKTAHKHKCGHACMCNISAMPHCVMCHLRATPKYRDMIWTERWNSTESS